MPSRIEFTPSPRRVLPALCLMLLLVGVGAPSTAHAQDLGAPPELAAGPRQQSPVEWILRDALLTRRLRVYGGLAAGGGALSAVGLGLILRNLCIFSCSSGEESRGTLGGVLALVGLPTLAIGLTGVITAGTRRRRHRRRMPQVSVSPILARAGGGGSLRVDW